MLTFTPVLNVLGKSGEVEFGYKMEKLANLRDVELLGHKIPDLSLVRGPFHVESVPDKAPGMVLVAGSRTIVSV